MSKLSFIGAGNMGGAIISAMIASGKFDAHDIYVCDKKITEGIKNTGVNTVDIKTAVTQGDYIILAVKPNVLNEVLSDIKGIDNYKEKVYLSIAAGRTIDSISKILGGDKIIRLMPNICLKSGEGMTVMCSSPACCDEDINVAESVFSCAGKTARVGEELIDACTAVNGSGPAYVFIFMEAMADAAVKHGIARDTAYLLSAQTVLGSAKLMLDSSLHPAELKDMVCSPGGTTIDAVAALEQKGLRAAVIAAVDACAKKAESMKD